jgi:hypothetical protein
VADRLGQERLRLLREAYMIARGERLAELRGRRLRRFDASGLHPFSVVVGQIQKVEWMLDTPSAERVNAVTLRQAAIEEAHQIMVKDIESGDPKWHQQE